MAPPNPVATHPTPAGAGSESLDFVSLYTAYFDFVWRCLRGLGVAQASVDDAAQDVFMIVHRRLPDFRGDSSVRTWLYGIVRNVAANQRRHERRKQERSAHERELESARSKGSTPLEHVQDRQAAEFVQSFLADVDEKKRHVFVLAVLEQLAVPEVAETLGIPLNTAYTRLRNVRIDFKEALGRQRGKP